MRNQRGFALLELVVVALIGTLLAVWGSGALVNKYNDAKAQAAAVWMISVRSAVQTYIQRYQDDMSQAGESDALASKGYTNWRQPTLAQLKADGLLSPGFPEQAAGALSVAIRVLPDARCPGDNCVFQALIHSTDAVLRTDSGQVDRQMIAQWLLAARGMGGTVNQLEPDWVKGTSFGFRNPPETTMPVLPVGTIAMAVTAAQQSGANFLRVGDQRNPDFQGDATVQGTIRAQQSLEAGEYLFLGASHNVMTPCNTEDAVARAGHRGLLMCQQGMWRPAGAAGGGFSTNSMYGCSASNGSSTANPVVGRCGCPLGYGAVLVADSGNDSSPNGRTKGYMCVG